MKVIGGILLVAGTTIGAGILALPATTAVVGFFPALILFCIVWAFMTFTALLFLELNMTMEGDVNIISMARKTLRTPGEIIAWVSYLLLLYSLLAAYISGSGALFLSEFGDDIPAWVGPLPFAIVFGLVVYLGIQTVDLLNRLLMAGAALTFFTLLALVIPQVEGSRLFHTFWPYLFVPVSVVVTSFGFHIIIPTLVTYLDQKIEKIRACILIGSGLSLIVYVIWQLVIMGSLPIEGPNGLLVALKSGQPPAVITHSLRLVTGSHMLGDFFEAFSFFVILTSVLGVSISLHDFLKDGLRIKESGFGRFGVVLLTFVPPLIFAWIYPRGYILALSYGGILVSLLLGLLPIAMVWSSRYILKDERPYKVAGGRVILIIAFVAFLVAMVLEVIDTSIAERLM